ncbi:MAG: sigma-70 family RNA polymerase sigma factor [Actinomycetota bacterium]|nr:sigma-70 family RNA polymerase sigma factor [Actinomycetota bacterium]
MTSESDGMDREPTERAEGILPFPQREVTEGIPEPEAFVDRYLLGDVAAGDESAFRKLYGRYGGPAYGLALRVTGDGVLAQDVVQDAFLAVWRGAGAYDGARGSVRSWLLSTVHHRAVDVVRREQAQRSRAERAGNRIEPSVDFTENIVEAADLGWHRRRVQEALGGLPEEQREVVDLMYFDGLTQAQVAERLSLPLGTVKSRCLLGMRKLRTALAREEDQ